MGNYFCSQWGNPAQERATSSETRLVWSWERGFRKPSILSEGQGRGADEEELFHEMWTCLQQEKVVAGDTTNTMLIRDVMLRIRPSVRDFWLSWWLTPALTAPWQATGTQVTSGAGDPRSPLICHTSNSPAAEEYFNWRSLYEQQRTSSPQCWQ